MKIDYDVKVEEEFIPVRGNLVVSGDDDYDEKVENEVLDRLVDGDIYAWCMVTVKATFGMFEGFAHLGGISVENEEALKSLVVDYDLKEEALEDLKSNMKTAKVQMKRWERIA